MNSNASLNRHEFTETCVKKVFTKLNGSSWNGRIGYGLRLWEKLPGAQEGGLYLLGLKCFTLLFCFEMLCFCLFTHFIIYLLFIVYSIAVVPVIFPFAPSTQPTPLSHSQSPLHCPCLWVDHTCSLTSPLPSFHHPSSCSPPTAIILPPVSLSVFLISLFCSLNSSYKWLYGIYLLWLAYFA